MLSELEDHTIVPPKDAIKPLGRGVQYCLYNTVTYNYRPKSYFSTNLISFTTFVIYVLYQWITGKSV